MLFHIFLYSCTNHSLDEKDHTIEPLEPSEDIVLEPSEDTNTENTENTEISEPSEESESPEDISMPDTNVPDMYFPPTSMGMGSWEEALGSEIYPNWQESEVPSLIDFLESKNTKSFLVLGYGKIILEVYLNDHTAVTPWYWASAGKTLTTTVVGIAEEEGFLELDDPVSNYLSEGWTSVDVDKEILITNRHLLTMTSGLQDSNGTGVEPEDLLYLADAGTRWGYHNVYVKLQDVVAQSTGQTWDAYFESKLKEPIGMTGSWTMMDNFHVFMSNTRSMARFGLLAINQGRWDDKQIVNADYFAAATSTSQDINLSYGYLWWINGQSSHYVPTIPLEHTGSLIPAGPSDMYMALGKNDQKIYVIPSLGMVVIRMGNMAEDTNLALSEFDNELWEKMSLVIGESF